MTTAKLRAVDQQRAGRLLLAWIRSDQFGIDAALDETMRDPVGTPGLLFSMTTIAAELALAAGPQEDAARMIESALLRLAQRDEGSRDDGA